MKHRELSIPQPQDADREPRRKLRPEVLYEDADLIAFDKPSGLLVIPGRFDGVRPKTSTLVDEAQKRIQRSGADAKPFVVHRIDRDASGVVLFAKNANAHGFLCQQFGERRVTKRYLALVEGDVKDDTGVIELAITQDDRTPGKMRVTRHRGRPARTEFTVKERLGGFTLMELAPATGRTHQLRVHMQAIGHPIVADPLYGSGAGICLSTLKRGYRQKASEPERPLIGRLALHAAFLRFAHPADGHEVQIESPLPKDFTATLRNLRKHART